MSRARRPIEGQGDLFAQAAAAYFPVRHAIEHGARSPDLSLRIKTALGKALKECPESGDIIAARMSELLGQRLSGHTLYTYTAPSKTDRQISLMEFVAFVRVTQAFWLWDVLVEDDGLVVLQGSEAKLARLGYMRQQLGALSDDVKALERELHLAPVTLTRRGAAK
jgi:hypothetical protein